MLELVSLRCIIVDDNASFLAASRAVLHGREVKVVAVAKTVAGGLQCAEEHTPDLILVDIDLGDESGFDLARQLACRAQAAPADVILISTHPEDDFADLIAESPVLGFVSKSDLSIRAIEEVLRRADSGAIADGSG
jgi:two-component system nitrate/nitrite response regulator NarL